MTKREFFCRAAIQALPECIKLVAASTAYFGQDGEILTGARPQHLANKDIVVAERNEDGTFTSHWERIYPSLNNA